MTAKELKNSILQLAIEGKLVEQRKEEGSAEDLYAEIQKEKAKLIKAGKIKKEKPLPEITSDEIPFEIPKSWKWVRLGDILKLENGDRSEKYPIEADYVNKGIPFFGAKDINDGYLSFENVRFISQKKFDELNNGKLVDKDIICLLRGYVGKTAVFKKTNNYSTGFICAQMVILRLYCLNLFNYFNIYLKSNLFFDLVKNKATGTAVRQLPAKEIGNMIFPLPPLAEQKRIVAKIEELMPLVDRYGELYDRLEKLNREFPDKLKNSILQKAIQGKLVKQDKKDGSAEDLYAEIQKEKAKLIKAGKIKKEKPLLEITEDEIPFEIPKSWKWVRLNNVTYKVGNKNNQIKSAEIMGKGKYPVVSQGQDLIDGYCEYKNKLIENIPLVMFGDHTRNVKYIDFKFVVGADGTKFLKPILFDAKYLYYWTSITANNLKNRGYARHFGLLCEEPISLPPLAEQKRIVAKIEELMPLVDRYRDIVKKVDLYKGIK